MATEIPAASSTSNQQKQDRYSKWDTFKETNEKDKQQSGKQWTNIYRNTKVVVAIVLFIVALGSAVCSKGALLLLTSNMFRPGHRMNNPLKTWNGHLKYQTQILNETVYDTDNAVTNVCYIWALFMVVVAPYIGTVFFFSWKVALKGCSKHTETTTNKDTTFQWLTLLSVELFLASMHTVGLSILVFSLLPALDPVSGLWYCCSVAVVPAICQLIRYGRGSERKLRQTIRQTIPLVMLSCFSTVSIALWGILFWSVGSMQSTGQLVLFILSPFMVSIGWLDNCIPDGGTDSNDRDQQTEMLHVHSPANISSTSHRTLIREKPARVDDELRVDRAPRSKSVRERTADIGRGADLLRNDIEQCPQQQKQHDINSDNPIPIKLQCLEWFKRHKVQVHKERYNIFLITNIWKTMLTFCMVLVIYVLDSGDRLGCIETLFGIRNVAVMNSSMFGSTLLDGRNDSTPFVIFIVGFIASFICHRCCVAAIKVTLQVQGFAIPIIICTPFTCVLVLLIIHTVDDSSFPFPTVDGGLKIDCWMIGASLLSYIVLIAIAMPYMTNKIERLTPERRIFFMPGYCGAFPDQSLLLNRWIKPQEHKPYKREIDIEESSSNSTENCNIGSNTGVNATEVNKCSIKRTGYDEIHKPELDGANNNTNDRAQQNVHVDENVPRRDGHVSPVVYLCATMWHENEMEMTKLLTSIFRLDKDQFMQQQTARVSNAHNDCLDMEANIFFDDAFMPREKTNTFKPLYNEYVETFLVAIKEAASAVYLSKFSIKRPVPRETPYGMQLEYTLPFKHKLLVHLKDKKKIRVKKRWSQVMYMYYLLSFKPGMTSTGVGGRVPKLDDIYILALDGDVDFRPKALYLLVERMKRNTDVGAACGSVHPIGSGWAVWYQIFEYATSHWLQKATEHVAGCVLCSPGCFSLYRGSALAENNVAKRYTTISSEALHYIQYDQGEDRWLCTLLLKQGRKVEYIAAADACTYVPEGFKQLFIQRRRWGPSALASIMDLLADWRVLTRMNKNISSLYMAYQLFLFVTAVLTPGGIFLLINGAITLAYPAISLPVMLVVSVAPVALFVLVCFKAQSETQLNLAAILSVMYAILMMIVIVGLIRQSAQDGLCSVPTIVMLYVAVVFMLSAAFHPKEYGALRYGFVYFLAIPSMSMLLPIYSIINLNNVSWGTREDSNPTKAQAETSGSAAGSNVITRTFQRIGWMCCILNEDLVTRLERLESGLNNSQVNVNARLTDSDQTSVKIRVNTKKTQRMYPPADISNSTPRHSLSTEETEFWNWLIDTYLYPMTGEKRPNVGAVNEENTQTKPKENDTTIMARRQDTTDRRATRNTTEEIEDIRVEIVETKDNLIIKEDKMKKQLLKLRNDMVMAFLLLNVLFVTIVYYLQQVNADTKGSLSIPLPCGNGMSIEPIGMSLTGIFGILLAIQFLCMLLHSYKTFLETISSTDPHDNKVTDLMNQFANSHEESEDAEDLVHQIENDIHQVKERLKIRHSRHFEDEQSSSQATNVRNGKACMAIQTPCERFDSFLSYLTERQRTKFINDTKLYERFGIEKKQKKQRKVWIP